MNKIPIVDLQSQYQAELDREDVPVTVEMIEEVEVVQCTPEVTEFTTTVSLTFLLDMSETSNETLAELANTIESEIHKQPRFGLMCVYPKCSRSFHEVS